MQQSGFSVEKAPSIHQCHQLPTILVFITGFPNKLYFSLTLAWWNYILGFVLWYPGSQLLASSASSALHLSTYLRSLCQVYFPPRSLCPVQGAARSPVLLTDARCLLLKFRSCSVTTCSDPVWVEVCRSAPRNVLMLLQLCLTRMSELLTFCCGYDLSRCSRSSCDCFAGDFVTHGAEAGSLPSPRGVLLAGQPPLGSWKGRCCVERTCSAMRLLGVSRR